MEYKTKKNNIELRLKNDFNPKHIFECGQAFRWKEEKDNSYTTIAYNKIVNIYKDGDNIIFRNTNDEDFNKIWIDYFDLNTDYNEIKNILSKDFNLKKAVDFGHGIRILNQEKFETIISFIISANNQIPRIKKSIELLSKNYGEYIGSYQGIDYFSFPTYKKLSTISVEEIREITRVGFRDKRIVETAKLIRDNKFSLEEMELLNKDDLLKELIKLPGVGNKVASCIMLFSFGRREVFPVDVWIKRVMEELYIKKEVDIKYIDKYAKDIFGNFAGYAQQYLFYYGRENSIGK